MELLRKWHFSCLALLVLCIFTPFEARVLKTVSHHQGTLSRYNHTIAVILAQYASAVYTSDLDALIAWNCSRCNGLTKDFVMAELIVDVENCLQALVGVAEDLGAIVIAIRGTQENSIRNWLDDLFFRLSDLNYPGMSGALVHRGFYYAYHNTSLRPQILKAVRRIHKMNDQLSIMVTGHSMGGAISAFCALDLTVNYGAKDVHVVTFGQPRVGNAEFASQYSSLVPNTIRATHGNDIVPHLPPYCSIFTHRSYHHFPLEVWIHEVDYDNIVYEVEKVCDGSGEDPTCSRSVRGNSIADHLEYYGISMQADTWGECKWVLHKQQVFSNVNLPVDIALPKSSTLMHANE